MSRPEHDEFQQLLRAHAGRTLTLDEDARMRRLAADEEVLGEELRSIDDLHGLLDGESALFSAVSAPLTAIEESDEGFARLAQVAARGEQALRDHLRIGTPVAPMHRAHLRRRGIWLTLGALAAAVLIFVLTRGPSRPALLGSKPDDSVLGGVTRIVMEAELRGDRPELSWHAVIGAVGYEARIVDAAGREVLVRTRDASASTRWSLSGDEFTRLRTLVGQAELRLRVVARDGAGIALGTTGDLPLRIVD